ncbi:MAG: hypothetical protein IPP33_08610 [Flavobacteriales bacterium]|nr:hypothetical protein [Flavobacteriales bacterium]
MKHRLLAELPVRDLSEFRFTLAEFAHVDLRDGGKEMEWDGFRYDLVHVERTADGYIIIHALRDDRETQVLATLDDLLRQAEQSKHGAKEQRSRIVGSWAPFCERNTAITVEVRVADRSFPPLIFVKGRIVDPLDPTPPKSA